MTLWHNAEIDPPRFTVKDPSGAPIRSEQVLTVVENTRGHQRMAIDIYTRAGGKGEWLYCGLGDEPEKVTYWTQLPKPPMPKGGGDAGGY